MQLQRCAGSTSALHATRRGSSRCTQPQHQPAAARHLRPWLPQLQHQQQQQQLHTPTWVAASSKGAELLAAARGKYSAKDLMGALKLYEDVMAQDDATTRQRQEALYGQTAVHATFGDVELAQITLREGLKYGLDFEQALADPEMVEVVASTQILIQLKRFNQSAQQALAARRGSRKIPSLSKPAASSSSSASASSASGGRARTKPGGGGSPLQQDLGSILGTPDSDTAAIDTSVGAILRRVLLVVLVGVALGTAMFFAGLEYLFPE